MNKPQKKEEIVTNKVKPTIGELEKIINDKGYSINPDGSLAMKDKEAIGYNRALDDYEKWLPDEAELHEIWFRITGIKISITISNGLKAIHKRIGG